jgi:hypothetical protein
VCNIGGLRFASLAPAPVIACLQVTGRLSPSPCLLLWLSATRSQLRNLLATHLLDQGNRLGGRERQHGGTTWRAPCYTATTTMQRRTHTPIAKKPRVLLHTTLILSASVMRRKWFHLSAQSSYPAETGAHVVDAARRSRSMSMRAKQHSACEVILALHPA